MTSYRCTAYVNVEEDCFSGFRPNARIAEVGRFIVEADDVQAALSEMWPVGNKMIPDATGTVWPSDVRSLSVGDMLKMVAPGPGQMTFWSVDSFGFGEIVEPTNPIVALAGTWATSRTN